LRRSRLKENVDAGQMDNGWTLRHGINSHGLRPGELKKHNFWESQNYLVFFMCCLYELCWS